MKALAALSEAFPPSEKKKGFINKTKRFLTGGTASPDLEHYRWLWHLAPRTSKSSIPKSSDR